jgi:hypothetical protein
MTKLSGISLSRINRRTARYLHHPKEVQYDEYDNDNDQDVNPIAGARESRAYIPTKKASSHRINKITMMVHNARFPFRCSDWMPPD